LEKKSIAALKKMCKERGLKKYSTLKKKQLVDLLQQHSEEDKKVPPLENVLDDVLEDMENLNIKGKVEEKTEPDFNEEDIVEEY
jgi:Fe2+ or Zn2+ uptake regulation protein